MEPQNIIESSIHTWSAMVPRATNEETIVLLKTGDGTVESSQTGQ